MDRPVAHPLQETLNKSFDRLRTNGLRVVCLDGFIGAHGFSGSCTVRGDPFDYSQDRLVEPQRLKAP